MRQPDHVGRLAFLTTTLPAVERQRSAGKIVLVPAEGTGERAAVILLAMRRRQTASRLTAAIGALVAIIAGTDGLSVLLRVLARLVAVVCAGVLAPVVDIKKL
jgi:hypothetical protein